MLALWSLLALASAASAAPSSRSFHDNGLQAQALNAQFQTLSILDDCSSPSTACIQNGFAQCVGTSWQVTQCPSTLICVAIPGAAADNDVTLACTTGEDALARIASTGATGGLTGQDTSLAASGVTLPTTLSPSVGWASTTPCATSTWAQSVELTSVVTFSTPPTLSTVSPSTSASAQPSISLLNGQAAQKANKEFNRLQLTDNCSDGATACISHIKANCYKGTWTLGDACTQPNTECFAVPLAAPGNGTTTQCLTVTGATQLIADTGATGGIYGDGTTVSAATGTHNPNLRISLLLLGISLFLNAI